MFWSRVAMKYAIGKKVVLYSSGDTAEVSSVKASSHRSANVPKSELQGPLLEVSE